MNYPLQKKSGFTLVELLAYVAILAMAAIMITSFVLELIKTNNRIKANLVVQENANQAIQRIAEEIKNAISIYTLTSVFGSNPGQLSLETEASPPQGEKTTYVDFYIDNGLLMIKREGKGAEMITSCGVKVTNLVFKHLSALDPIPCIQVEITVENVNPLKRADLEAKLSLVHSACLRIKK